MQRGKWPLIITFLAPTLILYGVFMVVPYLGSILVSFTVWTGFSGNLTWVGLYNYQTMVQDPMFWTSLLHNIFFIIVVPIVTLGLALLFASLLTRGRASSIMPRIVGAGTYRVLYFLPYIMPATVVGILWQYIYEPNSGLLAGVLGHFSKRLGSYPWLNSHAVLPAIAVVAVWISVGFYMVLFVAGIQSIPDDVYEAAALDGARGPSVFFRITIPLLWNQIQVAIIYVGIFSLDMFAIISVITDGQATTTGASVLTFYLWQTAFQFNKFGYACAMGTVVFVLSMVLSLVTFRVTRRDVIEF